jgi:hypothetical protein
MKKIKKAPALPDNRDKRTSWKNVKGKRRDVIIKDEIRQVQSNNPRKVIFLQKMVFPKKDRWELRLCYYMIGEKKGKTKGKWVFGQYATLIPRKDFRIIIRKAKRRGWI